PARPVGAAETPPASPASRTPTLEIPDVVVEGSELPEQALPKVAPADPNIDTPFSPPPLGPSVTGDSLGELSFKTEPPLFPTETLTAKDARTRLSGSFGGPSWFQLTGWDARQLGNFHSLLQGDVTQGTGLQAPWQHQALATGFGWAKDGWRFSLGADGERTARFADASAGQVWGNGRLSAVQPLGPTGADALTYRLNWESGAVWGNKLDNQAHGGDLAVRWEPLWADHRPLVDVGGGFHWSHPTTWATGTVLVADRFVWGPSDWEAGLKYQAIGQDHSVAPLLRANFRGWPETILSASLDGGQQAPFAGSVLRQRPFSVFGGGLRSEYAVVHGRFGLERRLAKGLVMGLGADAAGVDRRLYWSQVGAGPFWQLKNAEAPMLVWGGGAGIQYDLGPMTPFVRYRFQQASATEPNLPTDGSHDLRAGVTSVVGRFSGEVSTHLQAWNLSPLASGREAGAQPNVLLLDCALAYDITDTVQVHFRVSDAVLRSSDLLPGYWEPAFTVMGGLGAKF
ncbi:MAG: hypothetical protein H7338_01635, partial [Candidatus Sericytochromatia bacterium]|nr:hypothetical protein [Candidatus Sericytochromatia bacterium]